MAAKIGILGESTVITAGSTTTIYTVPADKAARVRILFLCEGNNGAPRGFSVMVGSPNDEIIIHGDITANEDFYTGFTDLSTPDPTKAMTMNTMGTQEGQVINLDDVSFAGKWVGVPLPVDYWLSTGDTVKFNIENQDLIDFLIQVVGVEDDA